jgi:hypothetical protein
VEDLQGLRRHTPRPEPRLGPRGRLLRPFALPPPDALSTPSASPAVLAHNTPR